MTSSALLGISHRAPVVRPAALVLVAWLASLALVDLVPSPGVADIALPVYASLLLLGPSFVYPVARRRGAGAGAAIAGALLVPVLWTVKECAAVARLYSFGEGLFYALNPLSLGLFGAVAVQVSVAEIALRRLRNGRWQAAGWPAALLACIALQAVLVLLATRRSGPTAVYWGYVGLHRWLFGG